MSRNRSITRKLVTSGNISGQQSPLIANHTYYSYSFTAFWEIDLFGRIRKIE